jgi:hypothetical protein
MSKAATLCSQSKPLLRNEDFPSQRTTLGSKSALKTRLVCPKVKTARFYQLVWSGLLDLSYTKTSASFASWSTLSWLLRKGVKSALKTLCLAGLLCSQWILQSKIAKSTLTWPWGLESPLLATWCGIKTKPARKLLPRKQGYSLDAWFQAKRGSAPFQSSQNR